MRALITGVNGFLGSEIARRLLADGHSVVGLSRRAPEGLALSVHAVALLGQAVDPSVFEGVDLVLHAAHDRSAGAQALNVEGTRRWAQQAREAGVPRQAFLTSVSAHLDAPSEYGRAKAQLEAYFSGIGAVLLRPGLVVGHGGTYGDMARMIRHSPLMPILGGDRLQVVLTDLDSVYQGVLRAPTLEAGRDYGVFQPEWVGLLTLARAIRQHYRQHTLLVPVPLSFSVALLSLGQRLGLPPTLGPESLKNLEHCRDYGYRSAYAEWGLPRRSLEALMASATVDRPWRP